MSSCCFVGPRLGLNKYHKTAKYKQLKSFVYIKKKLKLNGIKNFILNSASLISSFATRRGSDFLKNKQHKNQCLPPSLEFKYFHSTKPT